VTSFEGKVVIVTGGARGQGLTEATLVAERGPAAAICALLRDEAKQGRRSCERRP
jgi:3alpha(or 20beta)-hydroxysteroid dehydrogenase